MIRLSRGETQLGSFLNIGLLAVVIAGCAGKSAPQRAREVVIYVSQDRVFSEPILSDYERESGVKVNVVFDTEETKSTGLANRLLAEKNNPRADVFWSNEPVRTLVLKENGALAPYPSPNSQGIPDVFKDPEGYWTGFSARLRVIVYNVNRVKPEDAPRSIFDLTNPKWRGEVGMADPRFGSTSFHVAALYAVLGEARADDFFRKLHANEVKIVPSNSVVRDLVARGELKAGLTDTDDVNVAIEANLPVAMVIPDSNGIGAPLMPNMVSLIAGGPRPDEGRKLIDYLLSPEVERKLAQSQAVQIPLHPGVAPPRNLPALQSFKPMTLDYGKAAEHLQDVTRRVEALLRL
ncbi:MAG: extracellular solute-binding protein [Acidobacteria bacterium]|nr:extracellular solute-binding protein [Acidobacteriota bacterium]